MEVADDRDRDAHVDQAAGDLGDRACRLLVVDRDANELAAGARELGHLERGPRGVGRVRVRHRLHDDRMRRPDGDVTDESG